MDQQEIHLAHQAIGALFSATNRLQAQGSKHLQELSIRQSMVMAALIHAPKEEATINNIARLLGTSKQNAKQIIDAMEKKGYVAVSPNVRDKRALSVTITPEGERANKSTVHRFNEFAEKVFSDYRDGDLETLLSLLGKLRYAEEQQPSGFVDNMSHYIHSPDTRAFKGRQEGAKR